MRQIWRDVRAVALVTSDKGLGMATSEITIQDPVSIDISLPRFVAPGDNIAGKTDFDQMITMEKLNLLEELEILT